ncbi:hypothetical protein V6N13_009839 [Hibiscus sabdariffa]
MVRLGVDNVAGPEPQVEDLIDSEQHARDPSFLVEKNMTNMGLNPNIQSGSKSWAEVLEDNVNQGKSFSEEELECTEAHSEGKR